MLAVCCAVVILMTIGIVTKKNYKKEVVKDLSKKENPLMIFYGFSMYVADKFLSKVMFKNMKVNMAIRKVAVKGNEKREVYLYTVKKIALVIFVWYVGAGATLIGIMASSEGKESIEFLTRGKGVKTYSFTAKSKGKEENIQVEVEKKKLNKSEAKKEIEKCKKQLKKKILGKNKSLNRIEYPLNLVGEIGEYDTSVTWRISDSNIIGYDGTLGKKIKKEGEIIKLTATLELEKQVEDIVMAVKVYPKKETSNLEEKIQTYVDEKPLEKEKIELPQTINENKVSYYKGEENLSKYIFIVALVMGVFLFVFKDKDLDKMVEERDEEMIRDYPEIVSKFLIYFGAGLSFKMSLERILKEYKQRIKKGQTRYAYEEMDYMLGRIKNGVSEIKAISEFGDRCKVHCYMKFANIVQQNIKRGTSEMIEALRTEVDQAMTERKNNALKIGSQISTKLLGPMVLMLLIAIVIIMVPALMSINI